MLEETYDLRNVSFKADRKHPLAPPRGVYLTMKGPKILCRVSTGGSGGARRRTHCPASGIKVPSTLILKIRLIFSNHDRACLVGGPSAMAAPRKPSAREQRGPTKRWQGIPERQRAAWGLRCRCLRCQPARQLRRRKRRRPRSRQAVPKCKKVLFAGLILRFLYLRPHLTACSAGLISRRSTPINGRI